MDTWAVVFLGVIACCAVLQSACLIGILVAGRKLAGRVDVMQARLEQELSPALADFSKVSRSAASISELAARQARRADVAVGRAIDRLDDTAATVQHLVTAPLRPVGNVIAILKGVQRGVEVFFGSDGRAARAGNRTYAPRALVATSATSSLPDRSTEH